MSSRPVKKPVYHEFLPSIAKIYGINAAVIFQYISYREFNDSRRFVGVTIPDLMTLYPYMGRNQIWAALQALNRPTRKTSAILSRRGHGLSFEYSSCIDYDNGAPRHKFNVELATQVGVVPAIIYANVSHWIEYNWQDKTSAVVAALKLDDFKNYVELEAFAYAQTRPAAYHLKSVFDWTCQHMYIRLRTAERGFQTLVSAGLLEVVHRSNRLPAWHLPKQEMAKIALKSIQNNALEFGTAKIKRLPPKSNDCRQNQTEK